MSMSDKFSESADDVETEQQILNRNAPTLSFLATFHPDVRSQIVNFVIAENRFESFVFPISEQTSLDEYHRAFIALVIHLEHDGKYVYEVFQKAGEAVFRSSSGVGEQG